jgi:hypothetical protein
LKVYVLVNNKQIRSESLKPANSRREKKRYQCISFRRAVFVPALRSSKHGPDYDLSPVLHSTQVKTIANGRWKLNLQILKVISSESVNDAFYNYSIQYYIMWLCLTLHVIYVKMIFQSKYLFMVMSMGWDCLETATTSGPTVYPVADEYGEPRWNDIDRKIRSTRRETCPFATLSTANSTWTEPGAKQGLRSERPSTKRLRHGAAIKGCIASPTRLSWFCSQMNLVKQLYILYDALKTVHSNYS